MDKYRWEQCDPIITTGPEIASLIAVNYHKNMLDMAKSAIDDIPYRKRDISSLTLFIAEDYIDKYKDINQKYQDELLRLATEDQNREKVIQINFQMFPLSERVQSDKDN